MSFFFVMLVVFFFAILSRSIAVIMQYEEGVRFRLGRYVGTLHPGVNFIYPIVDSVVIVDMRLKALDIPPQLAITKDNAAIRVDGVLYYRPVKIDQLILKVVEFEFATVYIAQTTLRSVIGNMLLDEVLIGRERINKELMHKLEDFIERWGVEIQSIEIQEVMPADEQILVAMTKQVSAERMRRARVLEAESKMTSAIMNAEGDRQAAILKGEAGKQSMELLAEGEAKAMETVGLQAQKSVKDEALTWYELEMFKQMNQNESSTIVFPFGLKWINESLKGMGK